MKDKIARAKSWYDNNHREIYAFSAGMLTATIITYKLKSNPLDSSSNLYLEITPELAKRMHETATAIAYDTPLGIFATKALTEMPVVTN